MEAELENESVYQGFDSRYEKVASYIMIAIVFEKPFVGDKNNPDAVIV